MQNGGRLSRAMSTNVMAALPTRYARRRAPGNPGALPSLEVIRYLGKRVSHATRPSQSPSYERHRRPRGSPSHGPGHARIDDLELAPLSLTFTSRIRLRRIIGPPSQRAPWACETWTSNIDTVERMQLGERNESALGGWPAMRLRDIGEDAAVS